MTHEYSSIQCITLMCHVPYSRKPCCFCSHRHTTLRLLNHGWLSVTVVGGMDQLERPQPVSVPLSAVVIVRRSRRFPHPRLNSPILKIFSFSFSFFFTPSETSTETALDHYGNRREERNPDGFRLLSHSTGLGWQQRCPSAGSPMVTEQTTFVTMWAESPWLKAQNRLNYSHMQTQKAFFRRTTYQLNGGKKNKK